MVSFFVLFKDKLTVGSNPGVYSVPNFINRIIYHLLAMQHQNQSVRHDQQLHHPPHLHQHHNETKKNDGMPFWIDDGICYNFLFAGLSF